MNILVCGFMGSGKTTFIENFSQNELGYLIFDLDKVVCAELGISYNGLGDWIKKHGIEEFRKKEIANLKLLLGQGTRKIIALGGGTIEAQGFNELKNESKMIFLNISFDTCFSRIKDDSNRPMTVLGEEGLRELYNKR